MREADTLLSIFEDADDPAPRRSAEALRYCGHNAPACCRSCRYLDVEDCDYEPRSWSYYCARNVFILVRKGTCARRAAK